jgi:hypothetical protein
VQKEVDALRIVAPLLEDEVKTPAAISQQLHQANAKKGVLLKELGMASEMIQ